MFSRKKEKKELISRVMHHEENTTPPPISNKSFNKYLRVRIFLGVMIALVIAIMVVTSIYYYNLFVILAQEVKVARADIESTLQLRENMVPAILTTITDLINHENEIFIHAADVRAKSLENKPRSSESEPNPSDNPVPGGDLDVLLSKLFAIAERYPDLKTGEPFVLLMSKIADAEMEILNKRVKYNEKVLNYNIRISTFPSAPFAYIFTRKIEPYFQWTGKPEWVTTLDEEKRKRTDEILEKWRSKLGIE